METKISTEGIMSVTALTITRRIYEQVEQKPHRIAGGPLLSPRFDPFPGAVGYVLDEWHTHTLVGKDQHGKLYRTREDHALDFLAYVNNLGHEKAKEYLDGVLLKLPQIFVK